MNSVMACGGKTVIDVCLRDTNTMTVLKKQKKLFVVTMDGLRIKQMNEELFIKSFFGEVVVGKERPREKWTI